MRRITTLLLTAVVLLCPPRVSAQSDPVQAHADSARLHLARHLTPQAAAIPPAAPAAWLPYLGEYGSALSPFTVLEHASALTLLTPDLQTMALRPVARDSFETATGVAVIFARLGTGTIDRLVLDRASLERRPLGAEDGGTFRITPLRPVPDLMREALAAEPPVEQGDFRASDLVELRALDSTIRYDIRYATTNNFMGAVFYSQPLAFLQRPAAEAVARAAAALRSHGYGLLIHDAYRPWYVTRMFWDATPDSLKEFVADPASGSRHNRGAAVDLTLYDLRTGEPVTMVSGYDEFSPRAWPDYAGGTSRQRWLRALLRNALENEGFTVNDNEWWHFDYRDWRRYRIGTQRFEELAR